MAKEKVARYLFFMYYLQVTIASVTFILHSDNEEFADSTVK